MSAALTVLIVAVGLVLWPAAYHQLVARGEATHDLHRFITVVVGWTLLPFALSLGIDLFVAWRRWLPALRQWSLEKKVEEVLTEWARSHGRGPSRRAPAVTTP